jgi:starch phosphorylase
MLIDTIGDDFIYDPIQLEKLVDHIDDEDLQNRFLKIKDERKQILIDFIKKETGIDVPKDSIFDTLAKRLHAYKRQLLKALSIIYLIQKIKNEPDFTMIKQTFIFAAKAAPGYYFAKQVIKLITTLSDIVENDPELSKFIKVVFIPNHRVTVAEILMNATDVSQQISTAGKEASGTGNMKFMMNGAITVGTLDGANVEIDELVGPEHDIIFGLKVEEVNKLRMNGYSAQKELEKDPVLANVVKALLDGSLHPNKDEFKLIYEELIYKNDEYFVLKDFQPYIKAMEEVQERYADPKNWARTCLYNIAKSGFFSSDRTIEEYAKEIWDIRPTSKY